MQENQLFEYATIRVVPKVEREEFFNVGVILLCSKQKFLQVRIALNEQRLLALCGDLEIDTLKKYIHSFELICEGGSKGGTIGILSLAERFRWLTASRSTILQTSKVHPGLCVDANEMLDKLFVKLVACS